MTFAPGWKTVIGHRWAQLVLASFAVLCFFAAVVFSRSSAPAAPAERPAECTGLPALQRKAVYTVGFVQVYEPTNPYTTANGADMLAAAAKRGYKLVYDPPTTTDVAEQSARISALIESKVDAIVARPSAGLGSVVMAARRACIPVFTEARSLSEAEAIPGRDYVTHIGPDAILQGHAIAEWLIRATGGRGFIIELEGTIGASSSNGKKKGFDEEIAKQAGMKIVASESGDYDRARGHLVAAALLTAWPGANIIYAHSDSMALGALEAMKELGRVAGKDTLVVSIDGTREAVEHVLDGTIAAIVFNDPKLGAISFDTIEKYAAGASIPKRIVVKGPTIDRNNAATMIAEAF